MVIPTESDFHIWWHLRNENMCVSTDKKPSPRNSTQKTMTINRKLLIWYQLPQIVLSHFISIFWDQKVVISSFFSWSHETWWWKWDCLGKSQTRRLRNKDISQWSKIINLLFTVPLATYSSSPIAISLLAQPLLKDSSGNQPSILLYIFFLARSCHSVLFSIHVVIFSHLSHLS